MPPRSRSFAAWRAEAAEHRRLLDGPGASTAGDLLEIRGRPLLELPYRRRAYQPLVGEVLATVFGHPSDDLFRLDAPLRTMFGLPLGDDPALAPLRRWRDDLYHRHRGSCVVPA